MLIDDAKVISLQSWRRTLKSIRKLLPEEIDKSLGNPATEVAFCLFGCFPPGGDSTSVHLPGTCGEPQFVALSQLS